MVRRENWQISSVIGHPQVVLLPSSQCEDFLVRKTLYAVCSILDCQPLQPTLLNAGLSILQEAQPGRLPVLLGRRAVGNHGLSSHRP